MVDMNEIDFVRICNYCRDLIKNPLFDFDTLDVFNSLYSGARDLESIEHFLYCEDRQIHNQMSDVIKTWLVDNAHVNWPPLWRLLLLLRLDHACANLYYLHTAVNDREPLFRFSPLLGVEYGAHWALTNFWLAAGRPRIRGAASSFALGLPYRTGIY